MNDELIAQFTPETFGEWCREKFDRFTSDLHPVSDPGDFARAEIVGYVQSLPDAETNRPLLVMAVHAGEKINERSSRRLQFDFARRQLQAAMDRPPAKVKGLFTQGLFAFYDHAGNFRLSLLTGRAEGRRLVYGDFKRQSFFVAPDRENKTFRARTASSFTTWESLVEAFSVETLTKEFYNSLFAWYERAMDPASTVSFPNDLARDDDDRLMLSEHLIRLITRLMFVWFIRQKKLVPKELFDTGDLRQLLTRFDPLSPKQDNYYRAILQNLFFATLNCEIGEREFAREGSFQENKEHFGIKLLYRYRDDFACPTDRVIELFRSVPFLNGGLFECLDKQTDYQDGFSRNPKRRAHIPNSLFFDEEGLITLFARYDFTVDENSPNDADVALDPELLGKVFENLLGAYNPETRQTARKQSGSFYTPREIVNYMVNESLVAHLRTKAPEAEEATIRALLSEEAPPALPEHLRRELVEAIYHCRILDPACGSGAFPMGVLLKMVHLLQRLDEKNALWREIVLTEADKALAEAENLGDEKSDRRRRITESFDQSVNEPDYARKLYLIENCIFGVDIQSIAVQIAKLRAFITLVCDQRPTGDPAKNYGMLPLPNLETKFVAANTLIGLEADFAGGLKTADGVSLLNDPELHRLRADLAEVRHRHFRARNAPEKNKCRAQDEKLRGKIRARLVEIASKPNAEKIALCQAEIGKLQQQRRAVEKEDWRDVVRTTPTQGSLFETAPKPVQFSMRMDVNKERRDRIDDDIRRFTRDIQTEQSRARNKSAFQHEADRLAAWDPYNQNASSPFFDPEWMFDVKDGFDIVIGNPPYVRVQNLSHELVDQYKQRWTTAWKRVDVSTLFMEAAIGFCRQNALTTFISSNQFLTTEYGQMTREFFLAKASFVRILDLADLPVFDNTLTYVSIFFMTPTAQPIFQYTRVKTLPLQLDALRWVPIQTSKLSSDKWVLGASEETQIIEKLRTGARQLGTYAKCWAGLFTGKDEILLFENGDARLKDIDVDLQMPVLRAQGCERYALARPTCVTVYPYRDNLGKTTLIPEEDLRQEYPKTYAYLRKFKKELAGRKDSRTTIGKKAAWYGLVRYGKRSVFSREKIVSPGEVRRNKFALDNTGAAFSCARVFAITSEAPELSLLYLLGLLNSKLIEFYLHKTAPLKQGGYYSYSAGVLDAIPVRLPESDDKIVPLVEKILNAKKRDPKAETSVLEREIDTIVYRLYDLTPDEIAIVDGRELGGEKAPVATKPAKAAAGAKKPRKSVLTEDPDLA